MNTDRYHRVGALIGWSRGRPPGPSSTLVVGVGALALVAITLLYVDDVGPSATLITLSPLGRIAKPVDVKPPGGRLWGRIGGMRAMLRGLTFDPDPQSLPGDPSAFRFNARLTVGPDDGPGDETFDVTVCTPEWLAQACRNSGGVYDARHHVVVMSDQFDQRVLRDWFAGRVRVVEGDDWSQIGERLGRLGLWEFEDYTS